VEAIFLICGVFTLSLYILYQILYWIYIFPPLHRIGKASFFKSFFLWGQDLADITESEELFKDRGFQKRLALIKKVGWAIAFMFVLFIMIVGPAYMIIDGISQHQ